MTNEEPCVVCGKIHDFPKPQFFVGQKVKLVSDDGFHHRDKVGQVITIFGVASFMVAPCDPVEYETSLGHGFIRECRLEVCNE